MHNTDLLATLSLQLLRMPISTVLMYIAEAGLVPSLFSTFSPEGILNVAFDGNQITTGQNLAATGKLSVGVGLTTTRRLICVL